MKLLIFALLAVGSLVEAGHRTKRQDYRFPGPREQRSYSAEPVSRQDTYRPAEPRSYSQDDGAFQVPRRQFQAQPVQQYAPAQRPAPRPAPPPPPPPQQYNPPPPPRPAARAYSAPQESQPRHKPAPEYRSSSGRKPSSRPPSQQLSEDYPEEEEKGPDPLTLLLQDSKFSCSSKNDGYYADNSIGCQVFHYCVGGARHSWMCPEGTRFHQVHLNCVPASQDICGQTEKFHFVNDYLHKPYEGPNNTVLYHQKYYPEGYSIGDPLVAPEQRKKEPRYQPEQSFIPQQPEQQQPAGPPPQQYKPAPPPPPPYRPAPPPRAPAPVYHPAPPARPPPVYNPPSQPASPPRHVPRARPPSRPVYDESPVFRSRPSGSNEYAEVPRYQPQAPPSRPPPPPPRSQQPSRYVPSQQQQYGRFGNSPRVQYDDEY